MAQSHRFEPCQVTSYVANSMYQVQYARIHAAAMTTAPTLKSAIKFNRCVHGSLSDHKVGIGNMYMARSVNTVVKACARSGGPSGIHIVDSLDKSQYPVTGL